ncbi:hypothetical protein [Streptomyces aurantiogriseus]|nr:hypothetical protein [Streptomyces aurantiogriseus]
MTEEIEAAVVIGGGYAGVGSRQRSGCCSAQFTGSNRADRSNS